MECDTGRRALTAFPVKALHSLRTPDLMQKVVKKYLYQLECAAKRHILIYFVYFVCFLDINSLPFNITTSSGKKTIFDCCDCSEKSNSVSFEPCPSCRLLPLHQALSWQWGYVGGCGLGILSQKSNSVSFEPCPSCRLPPLHQALSWQWGYFRGCGLGIISQKSNCASLAPCPAGENCHCVRCFPGGGGCSWAEVLASGQAGDCKSFGGLSVRMLSVAFLGPCQAA